MIRKRAVLLAALVQAILFSAFQVSQAQVRFDVDERGSVDSITQPGFEQFLIEGEDEAQTTTSRTFGSVEVTISHSNPDVNVMEDRIRAEPTNAGDFTEQELLRDFLFARGTAPADGLDILIENLMPRSVYDVRIWSFDTLSAGVRTSDWTARGAITHVVQDDYTFDGNEVPPDPVDNDVYAFDFMTVTDEAGALLIEGRWQGGGCCGVFLNGMSIEPNGDDILWGDFTGEGLINEDDFNMMAGNMFGHLDGTIGYEHGDLNFDGLIDLHDFHTFVEEFPAAAAAAQAVPEPSSWLLGLLALLGIRSVLRRTHRG